MFTPRHRTHLEGSPSCTPQGVLNHGCVSLTASVAPKAKSTSPMPGFYSRQKLSPEKRTTLRAILATRCHDGVPTGSWSVVDAWEEQVRILADGTHKLVIDPWHTKTGVAVTVIF